MARQQFEQVVAQAPKVELKSVKIEFPAGLATNQRYEGMLKATNGCIAEVVGINVSIPNNSSATAGTHELEIKLEMQPGFMAEQLRAVAQFNQKIEWWGTKFASFTYPTLTDLAGMTTDKTLAYHVMRGLTFDDTKGLYYRYFNYQGIASVYGSLTILYKEMEVR